jgi:hypothetical protein
MDTAASCLLLRRSAPGPRVAVIITGSLATIITKYYLQDGWMGVDLFSLSSPDVKT